ncbi:hypothetical protein QL285_058843 [Trifolium repens]|nr:hypothetical protein QL285_058843 [Trifolium repens]
MSDKAMTMILELLQDAFEHAKIPSSFYEAKKTITKLGLNYEKIPVCPNDCMLYWGNREDEERETCKVCHTSKWKSRIKSKHETGADDNKKIPAKVLRYFPLKPRLQRLFLSSKTSEDMRWHALSSNNDGMMRHPRDSEAWKRFDLTHPWYLGHLKSYVRNKARPEGSIAEGYLLEEILTFCSRYLDDIETRCNRRGRADDVPNDIQPQSQVAELFPLIGKPVGGSSYFTLTQREKLQAHRHVLTNCTVVDYYLQQYRTIVKRQMRGRNASEIGNNLDSLIGPNKDVLISLAQGPLNQARRFNAYNVNGFKFRTLARDKLLKTQNSGVFGMFGTISYSSSSDDHMRFGGVPYYGRLIDIVEVFYCGFSVVMFKCEWANTTNPRGIKKDKLGFTSINFARLIHTGEHEDDEPYIKASEAQMVFYVDDEKEQVNDAEKQVVTANPDINTVDHAEDEFMVIACDGIWLIFFQVLGFYIKKGTVDGNFDEIFHFEVLMKALYLPMAYVRVSHKTSKQVQGEVPSSKKDN